jgi:hypothetical protein
MFTRTAPDTLVPVWDRDDRRAFCRRQRRAPSALAEARICCSANVRIKAAKALTKALSLDLPLFLQQRADDVIE